MLKSAVIGLGNIGFKLGLDSLRESTWSHVSAYEKCEMTELVGAVEINDENISLFKQHCKDIPVFKTIQELIDNLIVDIVSVCTPMENHYGILKELSGCPGIKGIFCEKPISLTVNEAKEMVQISNKSGVVLAVNHLRRWDDNYLFAKKTVQEGKIGKIKAINAFYPARMFNMGAHLFDAIRMVIQKKPEVVSGISFDLDCSDPTVSGWIVFEENIICTVNSRRKREDYIFEIDIIGDNGRIRISESENGDCVEWFTYNESLRYTGYRELFLKQHKHKHKHKPINEKDRFVEAINDIVAVVKGEKDEVNSTGEDGLYSLALCFTMLESAKRNGKPLKVEI
jgi:predicted dehydrogenase